MTPKIAPKSDKILTQVKLSFLTPLSREINVFAVQDPSKNDLKSVQKGTLQADPSQIVHFRCQGAPGWQHGAKRAPKGCHLGGPGQDPETTFMQQNTVNNDIS